MTNLIKELLALNENDTITPEKNMEAISTILKFDGDIPLGKESRNQADKLLTEDGMALFYVSINPPHGDCEAFVVIDKAGKMSYFDNTQDVLVVDDKMIGVARYMNDDLEAVLEEYEIDGSGPGRPAKKGAIAAYLAALKKHD